MRNVIAVINVWGQRSSHGARDQCPRDRQDLLFATTEPVPLDPLTSDSNGNASKTRSSDQ